MKKERDFTRWRILAPLTLANALFWGFMPLWTFPLNIVASFITWVWIAFILHEASD